METATGNTYRVGDVEVPNGALFTTKSGGLFVNVNGVPYHIGYKGRPSSSGCTIVGNVGPLEEGENVEAEGPHPLDAAISRARERHVTPSSTPEKWLEGILGDAFCLYLSGEGGNELNVYSLKGLPARCWEWLRKLGVDDPWQAMREEYDRAKAKHGDRTLDGDTPTNQERYFALVEEIGEIARALTYDKEHAGELEKEIIQLGGLALAWLAHLIKQERRVVNF